MPVEAQDVAAVAVEAAVGAAAEAPGGGLFLASYMRFWIVGETERAEEVMPRLKDEGRSRNQRGSRRKQVSPCVAKAPSNHASKTVKNLTPQALPGHGSSQSLTSSGTRTRTSQAFPGSL